MITASMATIPSRLPALKAAVESLLPQVDRLNVYLNGHTEVPAFLTSKVVFASSRDFGDRGDAGKFFWADRVHGYHLTCDDDLIYPPDYARTMVEHVDRFGRLAVVSCHGSLLRPQAKVYYSGRERVFHCLHEVREYHRVHVAGTGAMAYFTGSVEVQPSDFEHPNMADIWMAKVCQSQKVPQVAVPHSKGWLRHQETGATIFDRSSGRKGGPMDSSERQNQQVANTDWKLFPVPEAALKPKCTVTVFSYNRPASLVALLKDLRCSELLADRELHVQVFDDASTESMCEAKKFCAARGWAFYESSENGGKRLFWRQYDRALAALKAAPRQDLYIFLPDDVRLCRDFISRAAREWDQIDDPDKAALNLLVCAGREKVSCWTGIEPELRGAAWHTGWVDGLFATTWEGLQKINFEVGKICRPWDSDPLLGSGVGERMSHKWVTSGAALYRVRESLVTNYPLSCSLMNPEARQVASLEAMLFVDGPAPVEMETVSVSAAPGRKTYQMAILPGDHVCKVLESGAFYEGALLETVRAQQIPGTYVDVGAFVGSHAVYFAGECPSSGVVAIEPNPVAFQCLKATVESGQLPVQPIHGAIHHKWARCQVLEGPKGNLGMSHVQEGGAILCYALDDLLLGANRPVGLIKIDVEGLEPEVLLSAQGLLRKYSPVVITEAQTGEAFAKIAEVMPYGYVSGQRYNATPTYIWTRKF